MGRTFAWKPDPTDLHGQDKKFSELAVHLKKKLKTGASASVSLAPFCVAMNQYDLPSCVGNATCEALEILENITHLGAAGYQPTVLSRMFVWAMARTQEGLLDQNTGCYVRDAFNVIASLGVCQEATWPYEDSLATTSPSLAAQQEALGHTISGAYRIDTLGQDRLNDIITALSTQHPVVFGTNVSTAFENLVGSGPMDVPSPTDTIAGGHCMVVVGWDGTNFLVKNSWGTDWGSEGFCLFTPAYLTWSFTQDLWVPTLGPTF
jgi:C1A family cysteine protease